MSTDEPTDPAVDRTSPSSIGMGVSSERVGPTNSGRIGTTGRRDTTPAAPPTDPRPEQSVGGEDVNPDSPRPPVAGYNSHDSRSKDHPYLS